MITPLDRGNLVHEALERFLAEVLARPEASPTAPDRAVDARRPVPASSRSARRCATGPMPSGSPAGPSSGAATAGGSSPISPVPRARPRHRLATGTSPIAVELGVRVRRRRGAGGRAAPRRAGPEGAGAGGPGRSGQRRQRPRHRLQDRQIRPVHEALRGRPGSRPAPSSSCPSTAWPAASTWAIRARRCGPTTGSSPAPGAGGGSATELTDEVLDATVRVLSAIVEGIEHGVFPSGPSRSPRRPRPPGGLRRTATPTASAPWSCGPGGNASATTRRWSPTPIWPSHSTIRRQPAARRPRDRLRPGHGRGAAGPGRPRPHRPRPRQHAVRRGRRRVGQDHRAGDPGRRPGDERGRRAPVDRRHHLHREGGRRAARPGPRAWSCSACRRPGDAPEEARRCPTRSTSSTAPPSAPCTPSPSASCPSTRRGRAAAAGRGARRGQLGRRVRAPLGHVPRRSCSPTRPSNAPCCSCSPPACSADGLRSLAVAFDDNWDLVAERVPAETPPSRRPFAAAARSALAAIDDRASPTRTDCRPMTTTWLVPHRGRSPTYVERLRALDDEVDLLEALGSADVRRASRSAARATRPTGTLRPSTTCRARGDGPGRRHRRSPGPGAEACAQRLGVGHPPLHPRGGPRAPRGRAARVPRPAGPGPALLATRCTARRCGPACTGATSGSCSTSSRTPTRSRSSWPCASRPPTRVRGRPEPAVGRRSTVAPGPPVRGRRPEAVDLPVPPGRHRHVPPGRRTASAPRAGGVVELTTNFRTVEPVIDWVNHTFAALMAEPPELDLDVPSQPDVRGPRRRSARHRRSGPPVAVLGTGAHPAGTRAPTSCGPPRRPRSPPAVDRGHARGLGRRRRRRRLAAGPPRRHHHPGPGPHLAAVPGGRAGGGRHPVPGRVQLAGLRHPGGARPADGAARRRRPDRPPAHRRRALRTPLLGCGDDDLFRFKVRAAGAGGATWPTSPTPSRRRPGAAPASPTCASLHRASATGWRRPSCSTASPRDRRALELGFAEGRPRDVWRRLRFVIDQARAWSEATGGSLRQYLHWVDQQTAEGARVAESVLPETDDDAVRIMTIHAAKGLRVPDHHRVGHVDRPAGRPSAGRGGVPVRRRRRLQVRRGRRDPGVRGLEARSTSRWASTSASGSSTSPAPGPATTWSCRCTAGQRKQDVRAPARTNAELLVDGMEAPLADLPDVGGDAEPLRPDPSARPSAPTALPASGRPSRSAALARAARPTAVAATALTDEGAPDVEPETDVGLDADEGPGRVDPVGLVDEPDRRAPEAAARPRPAAVAQGPVRHRGRPGRPRRAPDHRPGHRRRASTPPSPPSARPRPSPTGPTTSARWSATPWARRPWSRPPLVTALAGGVRLHAGRRPAARGLRRPALPQPRRPGRRRLQDGGHRRPRRARPAGRGLPAPGRVLRAGRAARPPASRSCGSRSCSSRPTAPSSATSPTSRPRSPR